MPALSKKQNQKKNELIGTVKLFGSTVKANSKIAAVELKISQEKKQFGMDYIGLVEKGASAEQLKKCLLDTMTKIEGYREEIKKQNGKLEDAVNGNSRNKPAPAKKTAVVAVPTRKGSSSSTDRNELRSPQRVARPAATASAIPSHANNRRMRSKSPQRPAASPVTQATKTTGSEPKSSPRVAHPVATASAIPSHSNRGRMRSKSPQRPAASPVTQATKATGPGPRTVPQRATGNETHAPASSPRVNRGRARNPTRRDVETKQTATPVAVKTATPVIARPVVAKPVVARRVVEEDSPYAAAFSAIDDGYESSDHEEEYPDADPSRWRLREVRFNGKAKYWSRGKQVKKEGPIPVAIENFKAKPKKYDAMIYQLDMLDPNSDWDPSQHKFTVIFRRGTVNWVPIGVDPNGKYGLLQHYYEYCKSFPNDVLPPQYRDKYTDNFSFRGQKLHSGPVKPIMPGRGMGLGDSPDPLKLIKEIDPGDIFQGRVGNCWLLSGISALAQYDAAIKRLFRKTKNLDKLPMDEPHFMTITLWDLKTWKEVDVVIDERLCSDPFSKKEGLQLLGTRPSMDGELWVPYLEKALVAHCGGWDKIESGQCTHGKQGTIDINPKGQMTLVPFLTCFSPDFLLRCISLGIADWYQKTVLL
eukprot:scaffold8150_cov118-Cylindrotheca_fusiformis.AAC.3